MIKIFIVISLIFCSQALAWEEDPRIEEHNLLTSRLIKLGDEQYGIAEKSPKIVKSNLKNKSEAKNEDETPKPDKPIPSSSDPSNG